MSIPLPKIGDEITTTHGRALCEHFRLDYLVRRIDADPDGFESWTFDGVSVLREKFAANIGNVDQKTLTYDCALPHDLGYAYGEEDNDIERERVDLKFKHDLLLKAKMSRFWACLFYAAVRAGGHEELGLSFSWGFATKDD